MTASERFKKHWFLDRVISSRGYTITLRRDVVEYKDRAGGITLPAEWAPGRGTWILLFAAGLPEVLPGSRAKSEVVDDIVRAFDAVGWRLSVR
ncbi:hypothetical protein AFE02nite_02500 [Actinotalea fermentans]|uniref:Uncharacterized protein n=1 Tax=Actinotalea fermentans TaxID=43671 RepID=A0A511YTM0_9CELL|nr:hypothetical protein AFE02nite_02500 [Actinotalea fermentans]